ncbi:MAG: putative VacJ-like lipoprotein [Deltaproteobacteria bacterium]|nr:putative VacJ-like lipoprotein [Deltaproteobacteria bacterium]
MTGMGVSSSGSMRWLPVLAGALSLLATACAHERAPQSAAEPAGADAAAAPFFEDDFVEQHGSDPLEPMNRPIFAGNQALDRFVIDPVSQVYGKVIPVPVKRAVRSIFANLNAPVSLVNQVLQLRARTAARTLGRFALNSTLGFGGIFDPAAELGWNEQRADFGQTLGNYGVGPGFYLVLPLLGPSTARDAVGSAVDLLLRIDTWLLPLPGQLFLGGGFGISERDTRREELRALREGSIDFYAAVRSAYLQTREARIREAGDP